MSIFFFYYSHPFSLISLSFWQASLPCSFCDTFPPNFLIILAGTGRGHPRVHSLISASAQDSVCCSPGEKSQAKTAVVQLARVKHSPSYKTRTRPAKHSCPPSRPQNKAEVVSWAMFVLALCPAVNLTTSSLYYVLFFFFFHMQSQETFLSWVNMYRHTKL